MLRKEKYVLLAGWRHTASVGLGCAVTHAENQARAHQSAETASLDFLCAACGGPHNFHSSVHQQREATYSHVVALTALPSAALTLRGGAVYANNIV